MQCENPGLKGLHTCEKRRRPDSAQQIQLREGELLDELQVKHGYMLVELTHKNERTSMTYTRDKETGKSLVKPAVCIKLVVPVDSKLGLGIIEMRKAKEKK